MEPARRDHAADHGRPVRNHRRPYPRARPDRRARRGRIAPAHPGLRPRHTCSLHRGRGQQVPACRSDRVLQPRHSRRRAAPTRA
ncbi:hypothetical protein ACFPRL_06495 [Pseudoclavibacter helvolus]